MTRAVLNQQRIRLHPLVANLSLRYVNPDNPDRESDRTACVVSVGRYVHPWGDLKNSSPVSKNETIGPMLVLCWASVAEGDPS